MLLFSNLLFSLSCDSSCSAAFGNLQSFPSGQDQTKSSSCQKQYVLTCTLLLAGCACLGHAHTGAPRRLCPRVSQVVLQGSLLPAPAFVHEYPPKTLYMHEEGPNHCFWPLGSQRVAGDQLREKSCWQFPSSAAREQPVSTAVTHQLSEGISWCM